MVSRRSTRLFTEENDHIEHDYISQACYEDEKDRAYPQKEASIQSAVTDSRRMPRVDIGKDISGICPTSLEDLDSQGDWPMAPLGSFVLHILMPCSS